MCSEMEKVAMLSGMCKIIIQITQIEGSDYLQHLQYLQHKEQQE